MGPNARALPGMCPVLAEELELLFTESCSNCWVSPVTELKAIPLGGPAGELCTPGEATEDESSAVVRFPSELQFHSHNKMVVAPHCGQRYMRNEHTEGHVNSRDPTMVMAQG